jgi:hypothetical protein
MTADSLIHAAKFLTGEELRDLYRVSCGDAEGAVTVLLNHLWELNDESDLSEIHTLSLDKPEILAWYKTASEWESHRVA